MATLREWIARLLGTLGPGRSDRDLEQELRSHLELAADAARQRGATGDQAARTAAVHLGGLAPAMEAVRDQRGLRWLDDLSRDVRHGGRAVGRNPAFAAICIVVLALGIGANTAIYSVVDAVLLRPLAMPHAERVMHVEAPWRKLRDGAFSVGNFDDLRRQSTSFAALGASNGAGFNLTTGDAPERVSGEIVSADYFAVVGVHPLLGRVFSPDDDQPGRAKVVIVGERFWRTRLAADLAVSGRTIAINGNPYSIVGVMPKTFDPLLMDSDVWVPAAFTVNQLHDHDNHYLQVIGRLKPTVSIVQARAELHVIAAREQQLFPIDDKERDFDLTPLSDALLGDHRLALVAMLGAVGMLLLIACANIANLQLARARSRRKEMALRAALGASPRRIARQVLIEQLVLGAISAGAGVLVAFWGVAWVVAKGPRGVPRLDQAVVDGAALTFALAIALVSSLLIGMAPAWRAASARLNDAFKEGIGTSSGGRDRVRNMLVIGEIALALVLLVGAGLLVRSALLVSRVNPGFDTSHLTVGRIGLPAPVYRDPDTARQTFERIVAAAAALPGVQSAAVVSRAPLAGGATSNGLWAEGKVGDTSALVLADLRLVSPNYPATARIPLEAGRMLTERDTRRTQLVTLVNETLARTLWPGQNPLGKRFACCEAGPGGRLDPVWHEVVGVVADVRAAGLDREASPEFYMPIAQMPPDAWDWIGRTMDLVVRTHHAEVPAADLRQAVASIAPGVPLYQVTTMREKIADTLEKTHFDTFLLSLFAATALLLASVGIYGVLSYIVAQRTREIGIRMALGAVPSAIVFDVLRDGMSMAVCGVGIGLVTAWAVSRVLSGLLYGVRPTDAMTFLVVSLVLGAVAMLASYLPARRAARVDPIVALRYE